MPSLDGLRPWHRWLRWGRLRWLFLLGGLWTGLTGAAGASLLDDEIRLSRDLQMRLQAALDHVLGERKASVLVNVQLDLSEDMKARLNAALAPPASPAKAPRPAETAKWLWPGLDTRSPDYVLPGFPAKTQKEQGAPTVINVSPPAPAWDPMVILAAGVVVKKIFIKVLLDKSLPSGAEDTVRAVVTNFVNFVPARGDVFQVGRVRMPTLLEEAFQNPALVSPLLQKAATLTVVMLTAMCFFVLGLATLSTVRRSVDRLASAVRTLKPIEGAALGGAGALDTDGNPPYLTDATAKAALPPPESVAGLPSEKDHLRFDVPVEKVPYLLEFLANEELENVAVVVQHLPLPAKSAFMSLLSSEQAGELVVAMSRVSVVDPQTLNRLKEDLERHIRGSTGGVPAVVEMLHAANPVMRRQLLESLTRKDPSLGESVRERLFFFEDLGRLTDEELSKVISQVQLNDLATALLKESPEMTARVRSVLPDLSWKVLEEEAQHRRAAATDEKVWQAQDRVVQSVYRLVREGHISPSFFHLPAHLRGTAGRS